MDFVYALLGNKIIFGTLTTVLIAQLLKVLYLFFTTGNLDTSFFFSSSGMPSGHSAGITSLATLIGFAQGFGSAVFALAFGMAIVIMYDAMGVRQQAGNHAKMLNYLLDRYTLYSNEEEDAHHYLPERIGHTSVQVIGGALTGIFCAISWFLLFGV